MWGMGSRAKADDCFPAVTLARNYFIPLRLGHILRDVASCSSCQYYKVLQNISWFFPGSRNIQTTSICLKNRAARVRVGKGDKPVTYEEAHPPHHIAHRKGWLSLHTSTPKGHLFVHNICIPDVGISRNMAMSGL
ncbi:28S ribosomal protein S24, mitochondrial isoform X5 [Rhinatrema bivittatum]|uniref:28S ribosomal protein S24, mitochondrial isoform X5 n=1 Tax=Rhinatrema bivittatum TaxID=194408 RepID=UPI00112CC790|nr:28S ribosomal protein S24, mitochondrial isoform X5 [Rhinatrema bivittatum]